MAKIINPVDDSAKVAPITRGGDPKYAAANPADILSHLKTECLTDPSRLNLNGKTPREIADLLNANPDENTPPRWSQLMVGVPFAPNVVAPDDITAALG